MEIQGPGFTLRGWRTSDAQVLQKNANNGNVYAFLFDRFPHPYTMKNAIEWISLMLNQDPFLCFVIAIDGELAGAIGIEMRTDVYRKAPLIGYWLAEAHWGKGIMTDAVNLVTDYAFSNLDIVRLQAGVFSNNPRSMRVLEKCGFVKEGVSKSAIIKNDEILDEHIYALVR